LGEHLKKIRFITSLQERNGKGNSSSRRVGTQLSNSQEGFVRREKENMPREKGKGMIYDGNSISIRGRCFLIGERKVSRLCEKFESW